MGKAPAFQTVFGGLFKSWRQPERRSALYALAKSTLLVASLWEYVWLWHTKFYSRHFVELPLSLAWSLLTVIAGITFGQIGCSAVLKIRSTRLRRMNADISRRLTSMLAGYISNGDFEDELIRFADHSTDSFEECVTIALLSTRGAAHERLCELPAMAILRDRWIDKLHKRGGQDRRYAVEHLALLREPQATMALEFALDDRDQGIVAAAIRGLLRMPGYRDREALVQSLPGRPYLVRVLTASEESPRELFAPLQPSFSVPRQTIELRHQELKMRAQAVEQAMRARRADAGLVSCSVLAASGVEGLNALRFMAAAGTGGDAPAEALGGLLAAVARGGRS